MGLSISEYENATLREIDSIYKGFQQRGYKEWERARYIAQYTILPHLKKSDFKKITNGMMFPWEKKQVTEFKGDVKSILEKWDKNPPKK